MRFSLENERLGFKNEVFLRLNNLGFSINFTDPFKDRKGEFVL